MVLNESSPKSHRVELGSSASQIDMTAHPRVHFDSHEQIHYTFSSSVYDRSYTKEPEAPSLPDAVALLGLC